jgi:penicillin-binding protein 1A
VVPGRPAARDAIRADTAFIMTSLLKGVVERGTATKARVLKRPIAGKTGTTSDFTDGWFVGFEPGLSAAVWIGFDDKAVSLGSGQDGSRTALPIWIDFWTVAMKDKAVEELPVPANIVFVPVDASGRAAAAGTPGVRMESFVAGTEPRSSYAAAATPAAATP